MHADADFADTEVLLEAGAEAPFPRWFRCGCRQPRLVRAHRARWMRMLPMLRLYACVRCGCQVLHLKGMRELGYEAVYLPAPPLQARGHRMLSLLARMSSAPSRPRR